MVNFSVISERLAHEGITIIGSIVQDRTDENHIFVYVPVTRDSENRQNPSNRLLKKAQEAIKSAEGVTIEFLLSDGASQNTEGGLRATLLHAFGADIRNVFLSIDGRFADVWFDQKRELVEDVLAEVERKTRIYLTGLGIDLRSLLTTSNENLPGKLACLNAIRLLAPTDASELCRELVRRDFKIPSEDWLNRRLDILRKNGLIIRLSTKKFALSQLALASLGTKKEGKSPDVSKLLAMARKSE